MSEKSEARFKKFSENCPDCGGMGIITRYYGGGQFVSEIDCKRCLGRGDIGNCLTCKGTGFIQGDEESDDASDVGTECPDCFGVGAIGDCIHCGGLGVLQSDEVDCADCDGFGYIKTD